jgi:uncharacterized protein (TIGR02145 family)
MSDLIHKTTFSALTGIVILLLTIDIYGQGPDFTLTDPRDSRVYPIVHIGNQWWMAQNLDIGTMITGTTDMTDNGIFEKHCFDDNSTNCDTYGGLYQWDELMQYTVIESAQGICPAGWHIPSDGDWMMLESALNMPQSSIDSIGYRGTVEGGMLKQEGTEFWSEPNIGATNEVGFNLLPAGGRDSAGVFSSIGDWTDFWTSTEYVENKIGAWYRLFSSSNSKIYRTAGIKRYSTSARCLKDTPDYYETGSLTDTRDGKVYKTVKIGSRWWMAENLNAGVRIDAGNPQTNNATLEKYCYADHEASCESNGGLYQWDEMMQYTTDNPKGICPDGWHIPGDDEWKLLEHTIGMNALDIDKVGWDRGTFEGNFLQKDGGSGFDALLGGEINPSGVSDNIQLFGYYWSSSPYDVDKSWGREFEKDCTYIARNNYYIKQEGFSVRCIMDTYLPLGVNLLAPATVCAFQEFDIIAEVAGGTGAYSYNWTSDPPAEYPGSNTISVSAVTGTKYYLTVNDGNTIARDSVLVIVNPLPASDITGPTQLCAGEEESTAYSTPNNINYQYNWYADNGEITTAADISQIVVNWVSTAQTRSLNLVVADMQTGCEVQKQISVEILPLPSFNIVGPETVCASENPKIYSASNNSNYQYDWHTDNGQITTVADISQITVNWGNSPGTKTLNLAVADKTTGCHAEEQISVEVMPVPVFDITGPEEVCAGEDFQTYSAQNNLNFTYNWQTENGLITTASNVRQIGVDWGLLPGTKTLKLEVTDITIGCPLQKQINVELRPSPEKPGMILKSDHYYIFICTDSGQIYQWYHNGTPILNETKQFYYARDAVYKTGEISVEISSENGCKSMSEPYVFAAKSSAYNEDPEQYRVFIHPNPNDGLATVEICDGYTGLIDLQIINSLGQVVKQLRLAKPTEIFKGVLDFRELKSGIYFLVFNVGQNREIHKIFINSIN